MPAMTVLIPTRNRANVLRSTLEAMCRVRRSSLDVEFIVVDNASTDQTGGVLREFESRLPLRCLYAPTPGKSRALNRALREVELGEIVVFTDDDVTPDEAWLELIDAVCRRWSTHSVFGGRIEPQWPDGVRIPGWTRDRWIRSVAFAAHGVSERECEYPPGQEPFGPNYWVKRSALAGLSFPEHIGPHPTRPTLGDETLLLKQMRQMGFQPVYSPHPCVRHRIESERLTKAAACRRALQLGRGRVYSHGLPEEALYRTSQSAWRRRLALNAGSELLAMLRTAFERDRDRQFVAVLQRLATLATYVEAVRSTSPRIAGAT